ncbi:MAG TPA: phenylalanine--tRNA ligase subunit beta, partial [Thermoanaerobaculia bacterium]|nr:phenylalanine--tRNA ligase subunit beta [Thermoanaerobaculia bacterium]
MRFSLGWLREHVELPEGPAEVAARLTAIGHSVEGIEGEGESAILDVDVTTNRPDRMNHRGLARELAAALGRPLRPLPEPPPTPEAPAPVGVAIEAPGDCSRYVALVLEGVAVGPSPEWLARRLAAIGLRPINNVVDVTNYVLWDLGQPLHAFDLDRLADGEIRVRRARAGERLVTLDGVERSLHPEVLVIADRDRPVALAGIMGGRESEVGPATRRVLLESAHFDRRRTRLAARALGMHTDASHRFERGADPEICRVAAERAAALLAACAGARLAGSACEERACATAEFRRRLEGTRLDALSGAPVPAASVEGWLAALGFGPRRTLDGEAWEGEIPSFRAADFEPRIAEREGRPIAEAWPADLYEEVLRLHGLDRIPSTLPRLAGPDAGRDETHRSRERLRDHLAYCGLAEAIHFAFHDRAADARFPGVGDVGEPVALANPISERYTVLRRSLLPSLVETAGFNCRRGAATVRLFETGRLFPGSGEG